MKSFIKGGDSIARHLPPRKSLAIDRHQNLNQTRMMADVWLIGSFLLESPRPFPPSRSTRDLHPFGASKKYKNKNKKNGRHDSACRLKSDVSSRATPPGWIRSSTLAYRITNGRWRNLSRDFVKRKEQPLFAYFRPCPAVPDSFFLPAARWIYCCCFFCFFSNDERAI